MNKLPVFFISHGAPNILLQQDPVLQEWKRAAQSLPPIERILLISAHWETTRFCIGGNCRQQTIHDFHGFPDALYEYRYSPPADEAWADEVAQLLGLDADHQRGLDHGAWVPLSVMFEQEKIPVSQLSVAPGLGCAAHFELGRRLSELRQQGVLIIASGVVVHNLSRLNWREIDAPPASWAQRFIAAVGHAIEQHDEQKLLHPHQLEGGKLAVPTVEHYLPLLVAIGAAGQDRPVVFADVWRYGNLSQHCFQWKKSD
jgi:4,5-DOPA dioxygenase extradiol